jgi:hypothetical protein
LHFMHICEEIYIYMCTLDPVLLIGQEICTVCTGGHGITEPEFLNTLKCNLAESARTGFQFN